MLRFLDILFLGIVPMETLLLDLILLDNLFLYPIVQLSMLFIPKLLQLVTMQMVGIVLREIKMEQHIIIPMVRLPIQPLH